MIKLREEPRKYLQRLIRAAGPGCGSEVKVRQRLLEEARADQDEEQPPPPPAKPPKDIDQCSPSGSFSGTQSESGELIIDKQLLLPMASEVEHTSGPWHV
ncbi:unnamed protein product [Arctogadus glacialis]